MVLRPAMMYGLLTKRQRWSNSLTFVSENLKDIKIFTGTDNEYVRGTAHGERFGNKVREIRLKRELTGRRITGRPQKRSM